MAQFTTHESWVIAHREGRYSPLVSLAADEVFTTRAEADAELARANDAFLRQPLRLGASESGYEVMTLDEFIVSVRAAAVEEARILEFNGDCRR